MKQIYMSLNYHEMEGEYTKCKHILGHIQL